MVNHRQIVLGYNKKVRSLPTRVAVKHRRLVEASREGHI